MTKHLYITDLLKGQYESLSLYPTHAFNEARRGNLEEDKK